MNIDVNFFYGSINKYRRNREKILEKNPETGEITLDTMLKDNKTLFDLAKKNTY